MKRFLIATTIFLLILIIFSLTSSANSELLVYSAAGLIKPMENIAANFEKEYDIKVSLQFNGSGVLMNQIETVKKGDIFIAADSWYLENLFKQKIVTEYKNIADHIPVIIVPPNNPANINSFETTVMLAGATRYKAETLPIAVYLNMTTGDLEMAVTVSIIMIIFSIIIMSILQLYNKNGFSYGRIN